MLPVFRLPDKRIFYRTSVHTDVLLIVIFKYSFYSRADDRAECRRRVRINFQCDV